MLLIIIVPLPSLSPLPSALRPPLGPRPWGHHAHRLLLAASIIALEDFLRSSHTVLCLCGGSIDDRKPLTSQLFLQERIPSCVVSVPLSLVYLDLPQSLHWLPLPVRQAIRHGHADESSSSSLDPAAAAPFPFPLETPISTPNPTRKSTAHTAIDALSHLLSSANRLAHIPSTIRASMGSPMEGLRRQESSLGPDILGGIREAKGQGGHLEGIRGIQEENRRG